KSDSPRSKRALLQGWEQFHDPVDRIVSIGAFEHFGFERYDPFFTTAHSVLPRDGVMLLHTIVLPSADEIKARKLPITMQHVRFTKFIMDEIFPGGRLPSVAVVREHSARGGFDVDRVQSLRLHYARTLDTWGASLHAHKDEAIAIQSEE